MPLHFYAYKRLSVGILSSLPAVCIGSFELAENVTGYGLAGEEFLVGSESGMLGSDGLFIIMDPLFFSTVNQIHVVQLLKQRVHL